MGRSRVAEGQASCTEPLQPRAKRRAETLPVPLYQAYSSPCVLHVKSLSQPLFTVNYSPVYYTTCSLLSLPGLKDGASQWENPLALFPNPTNLLLAKPQISH